MSRGRRYKEEPKLNIKKVISVIVAIIVVIMFIIAINSLLKTDSSSSNLVSTTYFLINQNNKWGIIDNNAKTIIEPSYESAIIIPNNKQDVFICTYDENYEDGTYKTKVINSKNEEIFTKYEKVTALENYDENNNLWYEEDVLLMQQDGKYGLIDIDGKEILEPKYDNIYTLKGIKNALITVSEEKLGLVNNKGQQIIENKYDDITSLGKDTKLYIVKENGKYGIYNVLDCKYEEVLPLNNNKIYCVKENKKYKVIDKEEQVIFNEKFDNIESIKDNIIIYRYNKKYMAYDVETNKKLNKSYTELKYTSNKMFIAKENKKYGIVDINGEEKVKDNYSNINFYKDANIYELEEENQELNTILDNNLSEIAKGVISQVNSEKSYVKMWTEEGYKYYNLNMEEKLTKEVLTNNNLFLSKKDNKYGFIDEEGNIVVDYIYDDATEQNEFGYAGVKKDGLWGCIDKNGKIICETNYNLDGNLIIDFIGKYHAGMDSSFVYYTDKNF